jgi:tetratricopeptide (TPR) repeat protein
MRILRPFVLVLLAGVADIAVSAVTVDRLAEAIVLTAQQGGEAREDRDIANWQKRAGAADAKAESFERLGWAFVAKARRTLDAGFYKLAEKTADAMDARFGVLREARLLRGHVLHNVHRFREAEAVARGLVEERGAATDLGLLSDALMEQGKLGEAVPVLQRMVNLKPGTEAFGRIAHVRWLKGDLNGAIAAMEQAMRAGTQHDAEAQAWTFARLSGYYLQAGRFVPALSAADAAAKLVADYAPAELARGRALVALGRDVDALAALRRAAELNPLPEYQWWLADTLRAAGAEAEAGKIETSLKARGESSDPRTLALFLATRGEGLKTALRLAQAELAERADSFTHDAVAWAWAANGDFAAAETAMRAALAEGTQDARLFFHAGEIALGRGERGVAQEYFVRAQSYAASLTPSERTRLASRIEGGAERAKAD